jgi:hypothetical protein
MKRTVNIDVWRAAIKYLCGLGSDPELDAGMKRELSKFLRGPFAKGMDENQASAVLINAGWERTGSLIPGARAERTSPGYRRFKANPGADAVIADTLRLQEEALRDVSSARKAAGNPALPPKKGQTRRVLP